MPNWCENDLYCEGKEDDLKKILEFVKGESDFDFNKIVPYPKTFQDQDNLVSDLRKKAEQGLIPYDEIPQDGYNSGGYEWCRANWGTKWPASNIVIENLDEGDERTVIHFDTAWSPTKQIVEALSIKFPKVFFTLYYFECGAGFHGRFSCAGGSVTEDKFGDYYGRRGG